MWTGWAALGVVLFWFVGCCAGREVPWWSGRYEYGYDGTVFSAVVDTCISSGMDGEEERWTFTDFVGTRTKIIVSC